MESGDRVSLEELGRLLSLFVHDLRNPIAAISANAELLAEERSLGDDAREALADTKVALVEAQRGLDQLGFVASWLEGADLGKGAPGDLRRAILDAAARLGLAAPVRCPEGVAVPAVRLVARVVEALLANARDHAPEGSVRVDVRARPDRAVIEIVDGGVALSPEAAGTALALEGQMRIKSLAGARYGRFAALFACRVALEAIGGSMAAGGEDGAAWFRVEVPVALP